MWYSIIALIVLAIINISEIDAFQTNFKHHLRPRMTSRRYLFGSSNNNNNNNGNNSKLPGNPFGGMLDKNKIEEATKSLKELVELGQEMANTVIVGTDPSGQIQAKLTAALMPVGIEISEAMQGKSVQEISVACTLALQDAYTKCKAEMMSKITGSMGSLGGLGGMGGLPGMGGLGGMNNK